MEMARKNGLSLCILILVVVCHFLYTDCINFKKYKFMRYTCELSDTDFPADEVLDSHACGKLCHNSKQCISFSYHPDMQRCIGCRRAIKPNFYEEMDSWMFYSSEIECPDEWTKYKDSCYYTDYQTRNFQDAMNFCRQRGAYLMYPETKDEDAFFKDLMINHNRGSSGSVPFWVGITLTETDSVWRTVGTHTPISFQDFHPSTHKTALDCALAVLVADFRWYTYKCSITGAVPLCEK
ncbi:perlucin-like protein [Mercenaria mercenaria]|uniref:perlucin-like protein n=1 Tax=Mercenaria mercenaria TaxID=6596 RepID=UPI00234F4A7F|nr:perlucin-like protein [Mercenaria mercenaria]